MEMGGFAYEGRLDKEEEVVVVACEPQRQSVIPAKTN